MISWVRNMCEAQRPQLFLWSPVFLGAGIGFYFTRLSEPTFAVLAACGLAALALAALWLWSRLGLLVLIALSLAGFVLVAERARTVQAPVLMSDYRGPVEGRIIGLDRSASNAPRILLDEVYLPRLTSEETPARVRVSLHGETDISALLPGGRIALTAFLGPPGAPVEPGGFDFRRMAWFRSLGAVGYTRTPVLRAPDRMEAGLGVRLFVMRIGLSQWIRDQMPARTGAFAAAILTGDRSALDPQSLTALRASNLAHLLAISGLHMGLLSGFVFAVFRYGLALVPRFALRLPVKKIAAVAALAAGLAYLLLSGASIATQRAFVMTAVVLVAVMLDRPAFTLRAVAIAALIVLVRRPESLTEAGFQMSFAATAALIATFNMLRGTWFWRRLGEGRLRYVKPVLALMLTSAVAGAATAPFSAFHFNQVPQYGLLANLLAVPAMGLVVMPAAVIGFCLAPFGASGPAFWVMDRGIAYILGVAEWVTGLDGSVWHLTIGPPQTLPLIATGALFAGLWVGRLRILGLAPMALGIWLWAGLERPDILIAENGRLVGILTEQGRILSTDRGNGFAARSWLENDGDPADQVEAAARDGFQRSRGLVSALFGEDQAVLWTTSDSPADDICAANTIIVAPKWEEIPAGPCFSITGQKLKDFGATALKLTDTGYEIATVNRATGTRPWTVRGFEFQ